MDGDAAVIRRMRRGDESAFDEFITKYYPAVLRYCMAHTGCRDDAQDMTQETFVRFFGSMERYRHYGRAANYLYRIASHLCADRYRHGTAMTVVPIDSIPEPAAPHPPDLDELLCVRAAIDGLPEELRETAVLYFMQERKLRDIARILEIGLPLVKYRVRRARLLLAERLREEET